VLDVAVQNLGFRHDSGFALRDVTLTFRQSTHTAIVGPPGCGATTLLRSIAGTLKPASGDVIFGQRRVNDVKASHRPSLFATSAIDAPGRWSVQHALVAAVRTRTLDRIDRHREYSLAAEQWELVPLLERRIDSLSSTERTRVHLARLELLRPAILLADRLLESMSASARVSLADRFYRTMRILGTTVISAPSSRDELAFTEGIVVLDEGRVAQEGNVAEVFTHPLGDAAAIGTGEIDLIPITIRGKVVDSVIGSWDVDPPPFQGGGVALVRPSHFAPARAGEESDFVFGVEEAGFTEGNWIAHGVLSGGVTLRVALPADVNVYKGRLLAMRYDPGKFRLIERVTTPLRIGIPTDIVPPLAESR
jgi:ABC-type sugar transport system ATPase subunit